MRTLRSVPLRNLIFHWRGNLAVCLAVIVSTAVLTGALFVGDSLRGSLRDRSERQLNGVTAAWTGQRLIRTSTATMTDVVPALFLNGSIRNQNRLLSLPKVTVIGLTDEGFRRMGMTPPEKNSIAAILSSYIAEKAGLQSGDKFKLFVQQLTAVPRSSILGNRNADATTADATVEVAEILPPEHPANEFQLLPNPAAAMNVYVPLQPLQENTLVTTEDRRAIRDREKLGEIIDRVNALLAFGPSAEHVEQRLAQHLDLPDWGIRLRTQRDDRSGTKILSRELSYLSVETDRLVLDSTTVKVIEEIASELAVRSSRTTAYLANDIAWKNHDIPYSIVAAVDANAKAPLGPFLPKGVDDINEHEIVLVDWPESPLRDAKIGDRITLRFFAADIESGEQTITVGFVLKGRIPLEGAARDPSLTPPFPGITDRLNISDWKPPFTFDRSRIKPNDINEEYWKQYRTTPKAYVSRMAGEKYFKSRFGTVNSVRIAPANNQSVEDLARQFAPLLRNRLTPKKGGIVVEPVRDRLLSASRGGTDFGGLFLGFSFFLIMAALLLVGLMFRLNSERRAKEIGNFLAFGFSPWKVISLLMTEGMIIAIVGTVIGVGLAFIYSRILIALIVDLWPDPGVKTFLRPHLSLVSVVLGIVLTNVMTAMTIWLAVRKLVRIAPPLLLRGRVELPESTTRSHRGWSYIIFFLSSVGASVSLIGGSFIENPDFRAMSFFSGGSLIFISGLIIIQRWLLHRRGLARSLGDLGLRNASRAMSRSLLTIVLLGTATFLIIAVESFRRKPERDFASQTGGSGGFNLLVESDVPLFQRLDSVAGQNDILQGLDEYFQQLAERQPDQDRQELEDAAEHQLKEIITSIPIRVVSGDDASCLNLYQAGKPRMVGIPAELIDRGGFRFASHKPLEGSNPWELLEERDEDDGAIPIFVEQNTAMWMLKISVGDILEVQDDQGRTVKCRLVGTLLDSPFQSDLVMADQFLRQLYPREEGFRLQLMEATSESAEEVGRLISAGLQSNGVAVTPTRERVATYQEVTSTYLTTFQLLGGFGLLLGVLGLAIVILRGVWERLGEFALLRAVGYSLHAIRILILRENLLLLLLGVLLGLFSAVLSVLPHMALGGTIPWMKMGILLVGVLGLGTIVIVIASANAVRIPILSALRQE